MWGMYTTLSSLEFLINELDSNHIPRPVASPHPTPARRPETRVRPQRLGGASIPQAETYKERRRLQQGGKGLVSIFYMAFGVLLR
jgi:hypothetical protein